MSAADRQPVRHRREPAADVSVAPPNVSAVLERQLPGQVEDERLGAALANVPHGLCMFDADRCLILSNARYGEMYKLPPDLLVAGTPLAEIIAYRRQFGNAPLSAVRPLGPGPNSLPPQMLHATGPAGGAADGRAVVEAGMDSGLKSGSRAGAETGREEGSG